MKVSTDGLALDQNQGGAVASEYLQNRGRHDDKHGNMQRLYEVSHTSWIAALLARHVPAITDK